MAIPQVDRDAIMRALGEFDQTHRSSDASQNWEANGAQKWVMEHEGLQYPPKKIVSLATGLPVGAFSGGPETNNFLNERGFIVRRLGRSSLSEVFQEILERYGAARASQPFAGNHEIRKLFGDARTILKGLPSVSSRDHIDVVASYGKGNWAAIPWISLLDARETVTTQDGTYIVYLFCEDGRGVYVKIAQGVTKVEKEYGARAVDVLQEQATQIRREMGSLEANGFDLSGKSDLGATKKLAKLYEASTIASKFYARDSIPPDDELEKDLSALLERYEGYVAAKASDGLNAARQSQRLSLIGTWRGAVNEFSAYQSFISGKGSWASWWSFPVRKEAIPHLAVPFFLYTYEGDGRITGRLRVDEMTTSQGQVGIESPWPEATEPDLIGKRSLSEKKSEVFKTWLRVGLIEPLHPPKSVAEFEPAAGLSTPENLLNQNSFGYVVEDEKPMSESSAATEVPAIQHAPALVLAPALDIEWLEHRTGLRREKLQDMVDAVMGYSPQILLAGPPGTSKTWVARQLALYISRNQPSQVRFVQFHPSYTYESFIEGLRPVTRTEGISFELTPGIVVDTVREMRAANAAGVEGVEYVIVMDEANRANLPRVLGEMMFLFEYREQSVRLQYSGEFSLPGNLRFIGTMNTADRSIRSIDIALRRRFDVFELEPDIEMLDRYYAGNPGLRLAGLADGLVALNQALETNLDRHHKIGHAFFMRREMDAATLRQIWSRKIFPLIEEFFFDQPELAKEFSIDKFWPNAAA